MPVIKNIQTITINNVEFTPLEGVNYRLDYVKMAVAIAKGEYDQLSVYRKVILNDLFFIVYFVMGIKTANDAKSFVVNACKEVEDGPETGTLDVWAREHYKSVIITIAETLQFHLKYPNKCTGIFAYVRPVAKAFLRSIKMLCETSDLLKACFPDVLWEKPESQAPKWSEDDGLIFKRESAARKESTIEAWGLIEGMPTSRHFDRRIYDDIETDDIAENPQQLNKCFSKFEMSENLGMEGGVERIIGTFYSHSGPIVMIQEKKDINGQPMYTTRIKPATVDGTPNGAPVLLSQARLDKLKVSAHFNSQQLCDPTPSHDVKLDSSLLREIEPEDIPDNLFKFMTIDPAGDNENGIVGDSWGIHIVGVEPQTDDLGASNVYILDSYVDTLGETEAVNLLGAMYLRNGLIQQVGYERLGNVTPAWLYHFVNLLHKRGILLSKEAKNLVVLKHGGRNKKKRITDALQLPLINGKIHVSRAIPKAHRLILAEEMDKHPIWQDDGIDSLSYIYDLMEDFGFKYRLKGKKKNLDPLKTKGRHLHAVDGGQNWMAA